MDIRTPQGEDSAPETDGGYVYESPLIEQGSVILGGTKQDFGFVLRQYVPHGREPRPLPLLPHAERPTFDSRVVTGSTFTSA